MRTHSGNYIFLINYPLPNLIFFSSSNCSHWLIGDFIPFFFCLFLVGKTYGCLQICDTFSICLFPRLPTVDLQLYLWVLSVPWEINYVLGWRNELILNDGIWNLKLWAWVWFCLLVAVSSLSLKKGMNWRYIVKPGNSCKWPMIEVREERWMGPVERKTLASRRSLVCVNRRQHGHCSRGLTCPVGHSFSSK